MKWKWEWVGFGSGPNIARLFQMLLAMIFLVAWISLGLQVKVLVGARGLLPAQAFIDALHRGDVPFREAPTLFFWGAPDWALSLGIWMGVLLGLAALSGLIPRVMFGLSTLLYLSYVVIGRTFLSFQWDNLLLECGAFVTLLPTDRRSPTAHLLFRLILFKLYWESGVAKWQSHLHDWQDGSAMTFYYETAPIPAALAWHADRAPVWWHHFESWATLFFELVLPFAIFSPRRVRQFAAVFFTLFQLLNAATANYGFFCYLACALHVFLLDDALVARWFKRPDAPPRREWLGGILLFVFVIVSTVEATNAFAGSHRRFAERLAPFRLINTYHLFGHITRERIEPEFQTRLGSEWTAQHFDYKPGPVDRRPPYVAPHQPRVDFQLWFYGLSYRRGSPEYVANLLERLCHDREAVQPLFVDELPLHPDAVRIVYWRYQFSDPKWWTRTKIDETRAISCASTGP